MASILLRPLGMIITDLDCQTVLSYTRTSSTLLKAKNVSSEDQATLATTQTLDLVNPAKSTIKLALTFHAISMTYSIPISGF